MPEIKLGIALLFLIPGLAVFCALYGIFTFRRALTVAPIPPAPNSIKAVTMILVAALVMHGATALLIVLNGWICGGIPCPVRLPDGYQDYYRAVGTVSRTGDADAGRIFYFVAGGLIQGLIAYLVVRAWLGRQARRDALPEWLYGWSAVIANQLDNKDRLLITYVLSDIDVDGKTVLYGGPVRDVGLDSNGGVARITITRCDRYLIDLKEAWNPDSMERLAVFDILTIEAARIRNVAFEMINVPQPVPPGGAPAPAAAETELQPAASIPN